jgi:galactoside O-acetyltransferase
MNEAPKEASQFDPSLIQNDVELKAFLEFREKGTISLKYAIPLGLKALALDIPLAIIKYWPGAIGMKLRQIVFGLRMKEMGKNVLIGHAAEISYPKCISLADYAFIDHHVTLDALGGDIHVGRRVHIAPYALIAGVGGVHIGDYAGVGAFARIYSHSEAPIDGKRMSGPMIPESMKGMITAPVIIEKDGLVGTGAVLLPGVRVGEGAIVAANSLVPAHMQIKPWTIVAGVPARMVGMRKKVTVPDI